MRRDDGFWFPREILGSVGGISQQLSVTDIIIDFHWGQFLGEICARMEARRLAGLLGQHGPDASGRSVHFHHEGSLWVGMPQDGGCAERFLELLNCFVGIGVPGQELGLTSQEGGERRSEQAVVLDESPIEVGESEESLQFLYRRGERPFPYGRNFPLVHTNPILADDVPEELQRGAMELTFLHLKVEVVLSEPFEDLRHVMAMFGQVPGVYEDVVNVHYNEMMEELPEHLIHEALEDGW